MARSRETGEVKGREGELISTSTFQVESVVEGLTAKPGEEGYRKTMISQLSFVCWGLRESHMTPKAI
jgi:hypothetical protein